MTKVCTQPPGVHLVAVYNLSAKNRKLMSPRFKRNIRVEVFFKTISSNNNYNNETSEENVGSSMAKGSGQVSTGVPTSLLLRPIGKCECPCDSFSTICIRLTNSVSRTCTTVRIRLLTNAVPCHALRLLGDDGFTTVRCDARRQRGGRGGDVES